MTTQDAKNSELVNVLSRVKRGLSGYVSYLAACEMNAAFSEYVLYEPILRILTACGFSVRGEYECPGIAHPKRGDRKRLDFFASGYGLELAIEVKWAKSDRPKIQGDVEKLQAVLAVKPEAIALLCVFGRQSHIETLELETLELSVGNFKERGNAVIADLGKTRFGCRIYQLQAPKKRRK